MGVQTVQALALAGSTLYTPPEGSNGNAPQATITPDKIDLSVPTSLGSFTAQSGDIYSVSVLFTATAAKNTTITNYFVGQRGGGSLLLNGVSVGAQTLFTAAQFLQLTYVAGANGTTDDLIVAPETKTGVVGTAVQISASVTGTRSINAADALSQQDSFTSVAQLAAILKPVTPDSKPSLTSVGNFTSQGGDTFNLAQLYQAKAAKNGAQIKTYNVAVRGSGTLTLNGVATSLTSFTAAQFSQLQYTAGANGTSGDIVVAASTTTGTSSDAIQISGDVTGTRSINAANALIQQDQYTLIAQSAAILTPILPNTQPDISAVGNFSSQAGDTFSLSALFSAQDPKNDTIKYYQVAQRGGGSLLLNGVAVGSQTLFTTTQFLQLTYVAGANSTTDDLIVAAQTKNGVLSKALEITNSVSGSRSLNAARALSQTDSFVLIAQGAATYKPVAANTQPSISTVGNFSAQAGDTFGLPELFQATNPKNGTITNYSVALRGSGTLTLNGVAVSAQTLFSASQFLQLQYTAGANGTSDDLIVAALTTTGVSSNALAITSTVNGTRSINAADALIQQDQYTLVAQTASIFTQILPNTMPSLASVGNFTSQSGDAFNLSQLYQAQAPKNGTLKYYNVAQRGGGSLLLNGVAVGAQTLFTTTQFTQLQYVAGANGTSDDIVVTAQTLAGVASEAIQITNTVTGTRSINAANALVNQDSYTLIAQLSTILVGVSGGKDRPTVSTPIEAAPPPVSPSQLPGIIGAFQSANPVTASTSQGYASLFLDAVGGVHRLGAVAPTAISTLFELLRPGTGIGGSLFAGNRKLNYLFAIVAYQQSEAL